MMRLWMTACAAALALTSIEVAARSGVPPVLQGKVVYVDDGDTLVLLDQDHAQHKIRLTDLDAPETAKKRYRKLGQPFGAASGRNLSSLAKGKAAEAQCYEYDSNERLVCRVLVDGIDLSLAQIRAGFAWANGANKRYVRDSKAFQYESEARQARKGLWQDPKPIEPWLWRRTCWETAVCPGGIESDAPADE